MSKQSAITCSKPHQSDIMDIPLLPSLLTLYAFLTLTDSSCRLRDGTCRHNSILNTLNTQEISNSLRTFLTKNWRFFSNERNFALIIQWQLRKMAAVKRKPTKKSLKKKYKIVHSLEKGKKNMNVSEKISKNTFIIEKKKKNRFSTLWQFSLSN